MGLEICSCTGERLFRFHFLHSWGQVFFGTTLFQYLKTKWRPSGTNLNVSVKDNRRRSPSLAGSLLPQRGGSYARRSSTPGSLSSSGLLVPTQGSGPGSPSVRVGDEDAGRQSEGPLRLGNLRSANT